MRESKCQSTDFGTSLKGVKNNSLFGLRPQNRILTTTPISLIWESPPPPPVLSLVDEIDDMLIMLRAWDKENIWVPSGY